MSDNPLAARLVPLAPDDPRRRTGATHALAPSQSAAAAVIIARQPARQGANPVGGATLIAPPPPQTPPRASWTFSVPGVPKGQPRPRFARIGNAVRTYDPATAKSYKQTIAAFAVAAGVRQIDGPVCVEIQAMLPRPKRLCRRKDADGPLPALCKPDCDNIGKAVCDALIGVAYADDAVICHMDVDKFYHAKGGMPETRITILAGSPT